MKKIRFILPLVAALCSCAGRGRIVAENIAVLEHDADMASVMAGENPTPLSFDSREVNLGQLRIGERKDTVFVFVNDSDAAVILRDVVAGCGCTEVIWPKNPLMPSDTACIEVGFTADKVGVFNKKIFVFVSGCDASEELALKGAAVK